MPHSNWFVPTRRRLMFNGAVFKRQLLFATRRYGLPLTQAVPQLASVQCIASLASAFEVCWNAILRIDLTKLAETLGTVTVPQTS